MKSKDNTLNYLLIVLALCFVSAPWFNQYTTNYILIKSSISGVGMALVLWLYTYQSSQNHVEIKLGLSKILMSILFALGVLSLLWSVDFGSSVSKLLLWISAAIVFFLALQIKHTTINLLKIAWIITFCGAFIAILGIFQYLFLADFLRQAAPPAATFGNKNMAAQTLIFIIPISLFLLSSKLSIWKTKAVALMLALILIYAFYTKTRGLWLGLIVEWAFIAWFLFSNKSDFNALFNWSKHKRNAIIAASILVLIMINLSNEGFTPFYQVAFERFSQVASDAVSLNTDNQSSRYEIWNSALQMIKHNTFFGTGLGSFVPNKILGAYESWHTISYQRVHNDFLGLGVELGLAGLLLFIAIILMLTTNTFKILKKSKPEISWFYFFIVCKFYRLKY